MKTAITLKKNDIIKLNITGMTSEGMGVGHCDGAAVFVPLSAIGDELEVRIVKVLKSFCYGRIERIITPSPDRQESDCPVFAQCGGCCYRHISYKAELKTKENKVKDALTRIGGFTDLPVKPIISGDSRLGYRNKALFPVERKPDGSLAIGFYAVNSHRVVNCESCRLQPEPFNTVLKIFREWIEKYNVSVYDEASHSGLIRRLFIRSSRECGEMAVCVVINGETVKHSDELIRALRENIPCLTGVALNIQKEKTNVALGKEYRVLWGREFVTDELCGLKFDVSPASFYQVNPAQTQRLYKKAAEYAALSGDENVLDLYCGTGTIGLSMAKNAKKVTGVEIVPEAVENARQNALNNGITNCEFICSDAAKAAEMLKARGEKPDVMILDPPRKGCDRSLIETAVSFAPKRIVYISCDPATLARDLKYFDELGYSPAEATPVDMFPATSHVETAVLITRK